MSDIYFQFFPLYAHGLFCLKGDFIQYVPIFLDTSLWVLGKNPPRQNPPAKNLPEKKKCTFVFLQLRCFGLQLTSLALGLRTLVGTGLRSTAFKGIFSEGFYPDTFIEKQKKSDFYLPKIGALFDKVQKCHHNNNNDKNQTNVQSSAFVRDNIMNIIL